MGEKVAVGQRRLARVADGLKVKAVPVEVYSRVVGYYRPVQNWNDGKKEEFKDRKYIGLGD
jgi:hypothetical protein